MLTQFNKPIILSRTVNDPQIRKLDGKRVFWVFSEGEEAGSFIKNGQLALKQQNIKQCSVFIRCSGASTSPGTRSVASIQELYLSEEAIKLLIPSEHPNYDFEMIPPDTPPYIRDHM